MSDLGSALRQRYGFTWPVFGSAFLLFCYRWPREGQALNIGPPLGLLVIYFVAGQLVATFCAGWADDSVYDSSQGLFVASIKAGLISAVASGLFHFGILHLPFEPGIGAFEFRSVSAAVVGGALFPFLGCISAAATLGR